MKANLTLRETVRSRPQPISSPSSDKVIKLQACAGQGDTDFETLRNRTMHDSNQNVYFIMGDESIVNNRVGIKATLQTPRAHSNSHLILKECIQSKNELESQNSNSFNHGPISHVHRLSS